MVGVNSSSLARSRAKELGLHGLRILTERLDSLHGRKGSIVLISSKTVTANITTLKVRRGPARLGKGRTYTTMKRTELVVVCRGLFSRCGRLSTRVLVAGGAVIGGVGQGGTRGAFSRLLDLKIVPVMGRGSSVSACRLRGLRGFKSGSALSTVITTLMQTSLLVLLSSVSNLFASSPGAGPSTGFVSIMRGLSSGLLGVKGNASKDGMKANKVTAGLATTRVTSTTNMSVIVTGKTSFRVVRGVARKHECNALFMDRSGRRICLVSVVSELLWCQGFANTG